MAYVVAIIKEKIQLCWYSQFFLPCTTFKIIKIPQIIFVKWSLQQQKHKLHFSFWAVCVGLSLKTRDIPVGVRVERRYYFSFTLLTWQRGRRREEEVKKPRCGGGSTSRNKQEATPLSGPPAAADCHVARRQAGSRSFVSPSFFST